MASDFYLVDDLTLVEDAPLAFGPTAAGATSATQTVHLWYNKGTAGGSISNLSIQAVDPATGLDSGAQWLDETWVDARVNGGANPSSDPAFVSITTAWTKLGPGLVLSLPDLPGNCAYYVELRLKPPLKDGTPTASVNFKLNAIYAEGLFSLAGGLADLGQGIVTGLGDTTVTEFVEAPTVTATGTPDALVHVGADWFMARGVSLRKTGTDNLTLNQNDSAAVALASAEEYTAIISQPYDGSASIATKGLLAATGASVAPALPAENLYIGTVLVAYGATGSVIATGDITVYAADGRGKPTFTTGLFVQVAALRAIMAGARVINRSARSAAVYASTTSYGWLRSPDTISVQNTAIPAYAGAVPLFSCVANATDVTSVTDLRLYVGAKRAPNLVAYASNAAAIAAGLGPGDMFRTSADPAVLCVVT